MSMITSPSHVAVVTPSDTAPLTAASEWLSFTNTGGAQTLKIDTLGGEVGVSLILPTGQWRIRATRVYATGTSVTNIAAYWD